MTARLRVVLSGLPASGKSTLGTALGGRLGLPVIDKDVILEALFDRLGSPDEAARHRLSRAADDVLFALAATAPASVVVNWWHHDTDAARLRAAADALVEVHCACPVELAAARFEQRTRHPGHHDVRRSPERLAADVAHLRATYPGPLNVGPLITVATSGPVDLDAVTREVSAYLPGA